MKTVLSIWIFVLVMSFSPAYGQNTAESVIAMLNHDIEAKQKELEASISTLTASAVVDLEKVARSAVTKGDAVDAGQAWKEVLRINPNHEAARAFFASFGNLEKTQRELASKQKNTKPASRTEWALLTKAGQQEPIVRFRKISDKEWVELDSNKTPVFHFRELSSNDDFIEIYDVDRKMRVRIHASTFYVQGPQLNGPNHWESSAGRGSWIN